MRRCCGKQNAIVTSHTTLIARIESPRIRIFDPFRPSLVCYSAGSHLARSSPSRAR
ncbi:hypothetical protein RB4023 [Rhodopirellula baltica SH 1]|uniref:Uncharacterized protein n=1 Tax=Rhodopirellula baltica (strain DSM 10527 / NCIMB 13988 / SH1) TaxID=243090 RepID=Q7UT88_RHOBA|nr:hypothetical protein RB4023 [Rhodopirellula baltica SH 1]